MTSSKASVVIDFQVSQLRPLSGLLLGRAKESNYVQLLLGHSAWIRWALHGLTIGLEQKVSRLELHNRYIFLQLFFFSMLVIYEV